VICRAGLVVLALVGVGRIGLAGLSLRHLSWAILVRKSVVSNWVILVRA